MKLASHLAISRHGIYYFRLTFVSGETTREKRVSLRTKSPQEARLKASCLSAIMAASKHDKRKAMERETFSAAQLFAADEPVDGSFLEQLLQKFDPQQLAQLTGRSMADIEALLNPKENVEARRLELELGGLVFRDINSNEDVDRVHQILKTLNLSPEALAQLIAGPNPQKVSVSPSQSDTLEATVSAEGATTTRILQLPVNHAKSHVPEVGGTTIQEMVPRFATRKRNKLSSKALYEYGNYHRKFVEWLELRKKNKHIPVHAITRGDLADFIDDLLSDGLSERTVSQKYLPAISGLFDLAQTIGVLPEGQMVVSRGHKIFSKADSKKASVAKGYKPFTVGELKTIFQPSLLSQAQRPADFWLPMLGLFTGGRISELAQLDVDDVQQHEGIWALSINDEGDKSLKTAASKRVIPIHPTLIDCGFLDYVNDAKVHGGKLFAYLTPDTFGSYGATPSERWGKYLDSLEIKDPQKVFHSFRSTSNDRLKQNQVAEESRCQFVGHEHDTVNSKVYSTPHHLRFMLENVASKLQYPELNFQPLKYQPGQFSKMLAHLCAKKAKMEMHKAAKAQLAAKH